MFKKIFKSLDYSVLAICITLFIIGLVALFSANGGFEGDFVETQKQLIWFLVGFILMIIIICTVGRNSEITVAAHVIILDDKDIRHKIRIDGAYELIDMATGNQ